jgi:hypothetical protein
MDKELSYGEALLKFEDILGQWDIELTLSGESHSINAELEILRTDVYADPVFVTQVIDKTSIYDALCQLLKDFTFWEKSYDNE